MPFMCTQPLITMRLLLKSIFVCFLLLPVLWSCNSDKLKTGARGYDSKSVVDGAIFVRDSAGNDAVGRYLDSMAWFSSSDAHIVYDIYGFRHAHYLNVVKDYGRALLYADSMLFLVNSRKDIDWDASLLANAYNAKADIYFEKGRYRQAFEWYNKARQLSDKELNSCLQGAYLFRIAMSLYQQERYEEAADGFSLCFRKTSNCDSSFAQWIRWQEILNNAGLSFYKAGNTDSARHYYNSSLRLIEQLRLHFPKNRSTYEEAKSIVYGNLGTLYTEAGSNDTAEFYLLYSLQLNREAGKSPKDALFTKLALASLYVNVGKSEKAEPLLKLVASEAARHTDRDVQYRLYNVWRKYYTLKGDYALALNYQGAAAAMKDTLNQLSKKALLNDLRQGLQEQEVQYRLSALEKDKKIRDLTTSILFLISVLGTGVILFAGRFILRLKKNLHIHKQLNDSISRQSRQKEQLLQEEIGQSGINLRALIDNTDDLIWSVDRNLNLLSFNKAYEDWTFQMTGSHAKAGEPEPVADVLPKFYGTWKKQYDVCFQGKPVKFLEKGIDHGPRELSWECSFRPIHQRDGRVTGVSCFCSDMTESLDKLDQIQRQNERLKKIAWIQSHKVRSPVATLKGLILLVNKDNPADPQNAELIEMMEASVDQLDEVIHEITHQATHKVV
ncbi:MAG: tetratricopeptide repeat protein [Sphingobacteriales bacterium]|nr:MAG: tetratricopeptide repeat protein [Sphingobacteriales bacterium]